MVKKLHAKHPLWITCICDKIFAMEIHTDYYSLIPYPNLLYIDSFLAWDERVVMDYAENTKKIILTHYTQKPWAILHNSTHWELPTPGGMDLLTTLANSKISGKITHHAYVAGPSEIKKWLWEKVFKNVQTYTAETFATQGDAEAWLASFGYHRTIPLSEK